jgi:hypothetical protein
MHRQIVATSASQGQRATAKLSGTSTRRRLVAEGVFGVLENFGARRAQWDANHVRNPIGHNGEAKQFYDLSRVALPLYLVANLNPVHGQALLLLLARISVARGVAADQAVTVVTLPQ